ncbi:MAG: hypothetical protein LBG66_01745 [Gallionellaceae bacterium]|nr:hypothetical protein [Gallionellaceae bacterium]
MSRIKNERLLESLLFLAHAGFKVVPVDCKCVDGVWFDFLVQSHRRVMEHAPHLIWESQ